VSERGVADRTGAMMMMTTSATSRAVSTRASARRSEATTTMKKMTMAMTMATGGRARVVVTTRRRDAIVVAVVGKRSESDVEERTRVRSEEASALMGRTGGSATRVGLVALAAALAATRAEPALAAMDAQGAMGWVAGLFAWIPNAMSTPEAKELFLYTLKTLISWGIPTVTVAAGAFFAISASRRGGPKGEKSGPFGFIKGGGAGSKPRTEPYLEIKRMNDKLDSYSLSFEAATVSEIQAERRRKSMDFSKKFGAALGSLSEDERDAIFEANKKWAMTDKRLMEQMNQLLAQMRAAALESGGKRSKSNGEESSDSEEGDEGEKGGFKNPFGGDKVTKLTKKLSKVAAERASAEDAYLQAVGAALPKSRRDSLMKLLSDPRAIAGWQTNTDVLALNPETDENSKLKKKHVFVLNFFGDVRASQAEQLREEVTGLLRSAKKERGDEVVLRLNTGGGTVTGYGLAAAQLTRIKDAGLKLTICVEQVAASGGYMMACVADEIVASPFAVLGSIGVISEQPNVYERLLREGIEFQTVTAGKFKRTLTPTKKVTKEDLAKSKKDIEDVLVLFKDFVAENRPALDIENVATGETWFGKDALSRNLVDKLKTSDDVLLDLLAGGAEIFSVQLKQPSPAATLFGGAGANAATWQWDILQRMALGVADYAGSYGSTTQRGMARGPMMIDVNRAADNVVAYDEETDSYIDTV